MNAPTQPARPYEELLEELTLRRCELAGTAEAFRFLVGIADGDKERIESACAMYDTAHARWEAAHDALHIALMEITS